jgi:hypothetical protein
MSAGFVLVRRMYTRETGHLQRILQGTNAQICKVFVSLFLRRWSGVGGILSPKGKTAMTRTIFAALLLALSVSVASAYTIVMRNGRRVEIPNKFTVTQTGLTYEAGHGIQVTIQLTGVDVAATERANGEPYGSLLQRASAQDAEAKPAERPANANRSVTNRDLEVYRRARIQSELAYEKRRKELGLPSVEEHRRKNAAIEERTREELSSMRAQEQNAEQYWRSRASELRTGIASNQAQIDFVRQRLDELPVTNSFGGFSTPVPFGSGFPFQNPLTPGVLGPSITTTTRIGTNALLHRNWRSSQYFPGLNNRSHRGRGRFSPFGGGNVLALPFQSFDYSQERTELVNQLNELEMQRAGFQARWRELEEEARRAGAYPGWLRP